jgi:putative drug exporter of the RND superfamily
MGPLKLETIAGVCARNPWRTIAVWVLLIAAGVVLQATLLGDALTTGGSFTNEPESARAHSLLEERLRGPANLTELVIVRSETLSVDDPLFADRVRSIAGDLRALGPEVVENVFTYVEAPEAGLVSDDGRATIIPVALAGDVDQALKNASPVLDTAALADGSDGFEVLVAGEASIGEDFMRIAKHDALTGEAIGVGVALVILVIVFGALVAAALPVILAATSIVVALGLTALLGQAWELAFSVTNIITMMGLAVGIDYSLFIVSRFREERRAGRPMLAAVERAQGSAGRAVLFSGMTVVVALCGLFIMPSTVFRSLAAGAVLVVTVAVMAALTLLPALLALLGDRVESLRPGTALRWLLGRGDGGSDPVSEPEEGSARGGFWDGVTHSVMARPVLSLVLAALPLVVAASFYLDLNPGAAGVSTLPDSARTKAAFEMLDSDFSFGQLSPVEVVIDGPSDHPEVQAALERLQAEVAGDVAFAGPGMVEQNPEAEVTVLTLALTLDPNSLAAEDAVRRLRSEYVADAFAGVPAHALVGGPTALNVDFFAAIDRYTPLVFAFVLGLSFVLLTMVFRSLVVPVKAILMNLLSVGSAYGLMVLVFQKGVGADLLGVQQTPRIEAWLPLFLFAILFGLSMDYHVLLLSRIRERYDETGDNTASVAFGLRSTAGLITGAAAIMVAVFGGFAAGDLVMFQQMGFGLAVAVFLDATVVRSILVPAAMKLLGAGNWWLPRPLDWLPDLRVEPAHQHQSEPVLVREHVRG